MKKILKIGGMSCAACSARVERFVKKIPGVNSAIVNLPFETLNVDFDDTLTNIAAIEAAVIKAGYTIIDNPDEQISSQEQLSSLKKRLTVSITFLIPLLFLTTVPLFTDTIIPNVINPFFSPINYALAELFLTFPIIIMAIDLYKKGLKNLVSFAPDMDSLIAIGTLSAFIYSIFSLVLLVNGNVQYSRQLYFESAASVLTLITLGKYLETKAKQKASDSVRSLLTLTPKTAIVYRNGQERTVPVSEIEVNDIIIVKPGEALPADGIITEGTGFINESMLTGESLPVEKEINDPVIGGTINETGYFKYTATNIGNESTLMRIVRLIEEAQSSKAPISRTADTAAGYFVPIVIILALCAAIFWLFLGKPASFVLTIFVSVLVVACPCSLGLATPAAIMAGTGRAAEYGILFKGGDILETLEKIDTIYFDKTGTLTKGQLTVTNIWSNSMSTDELLSLAAFAEQGSEHPIAQAICAKATEKGFTIQNPENFTAFPGLGVEAFVFGTTVNVGRLNWLKKLNICVPRLIEAKAADFASNGCTPIFISKNGYCIGIIALSDILKDEAKDTIRQLKSRGINVVLLTGDNKHTASKIAAMAGITEYHAEMLPIDKAAIIKKAQKSGHITAMAGDGINDAPALTVADIGLAVGSGTDIAIDSADVVLMHSNLQDIIRALNFSKQTMKIIKQNLFWAFAYNTLGIPIAMGILHLFGGPLLNPMICAAAMSLSSISVVTNALRLKRLIP